MNRKGEMVKIFDTMQGKYSKYEIFSDWIRCTALSISNSCQLWNNAIWEEREKAYIDTMNRYTDKEKENFYKLTACLVDTLEDGPDDVLGDLYMMADMGSKSSGQFFTPFHLSVLSAKIGLTRIIEQYKNGEIDKITLNEPSCGGGAMVIAAAKVIKDAGINYQKAMDVVAQDLDWKGVYMCYVQLSLLGISAICVQGDTLADPYTPGKTEARHILITPAKRGALI